MPSPAEPAYDVVVIGAGHNGLTLGTYLARSGLRVCILETSDSVGGLSQTREVLPGFVGNMATNSPHNLDPQVMSDLRLEDFGLEWISVGDPSSAALLPNGERIIAFRDARRDAEFDQFAPGEAARYFGLLDELNQLGRDLDVSFYEPPPSFEEVTARVPAGKEELFELVMNGSAAELVDRYLTTDQAKASLAMLAVSGNFVGPHTPGSAFALMQRPLYRGAATARSRASAVLGTSEYAPRTVRGGMGAVTQAMARAALAAGAEIRVLSHVDHVIVEGGSARGVVLRNGDEVRAGAVVSAMNPIATLKFLVDPAELPDSVHAEMDSIDMEGCLAKVYIGIEGQPHFAAARNAEEQQILARCGLRMGPYMPAIEESYQLARAGSWKGEPVAYSLMQTAFDDSLNAPGRHLMSISVCYAPRTLDSGTWPEQKDAWVGSVVDWITQHIPNLPDIIVETGGLTTEELEDEFGLYRGNALHRDVVTDTMFHARPLSGYSDYTSPIDGLFFCSVGTWPANYVSGLGGRNASERLLAWKRRD